MRLNRRILIAVVSAVATLFAFAANAFAATPCLGPAYEPEMPKKLRPTK